MLEIFQQSAEAVGAVIKHFSTAVEVRAYLAALAAKGNVTLTPLPEKYAALCEGFTLGMDDPANATLCISHAEAGIAATGSLLIDLANREGRAATALAPVHAVFLDPATIVPTLSDLSHRIGQLIEGSDRAYFSLTTGPSRTADIERVLTIGVHGPKELHILVLGNDTFTP